MRTTFLDVARRATAWVHRAINFGGGPAASDAAWNDFTGLVVKRTWERRTHTLIIVQATPSVANGTAWMRVLVDGNRVGETWRLSSTGTVDLGYSKVIPWVAEAGPHEIKLQHRGAGTMIVLGAQGSDKDIYPAIEVVNVGGGA